VKNELLMGRDLSKKGSRKRRPEYAERIAQGHRAVRMTAALRPGWLSVIDIICQPA
jgi:hypothetical protein